MSESNRRCWTGQTRSLSGALLTPTEGIHQRVSYRQSRYDNEDREEYELERQLRDGDSEDGQEVVRLCNLYVVVLMRRVYAKTRVVVNRKVLSNVPYRLNGPSLSRQTRETSLQLGLAHLACLARLASQNQLPPS